MRPAALPFVLLLASCEFAHAQPAGMPLEPGVRVRVSILATRVPEPDSTRFQSGKRYVGSLLRYDDTTLALSEVTPEIPWRIVEKLERSTGRHGSAGKGALIGGLAGLVAGVIVGVVASESEADSFFDPAEVYPVGLGLGGALVGTGLGALIGGRIKHDGWSPVPLRPSGTRPAPADSSR